MILVGLLLILVGLLYAAGEVMFGAILRFLARERADPSPSPGCAA